MLFYNYRFSFSHCNTTHEKTSGQIAVLVQNFLPELFQPYLLCAGYESAEHGSCQGDSGGPLMIFNTKTSQYIQEGLVAGSVSFCGDPGIPAYYTRLNHPDIINFIQEPEKFSLGGIFIHCFIF